MRIWLVNVGEPMVVDPGSERKLRMGIVADMLADAGHEVVWWTSTFDHNYKRQRYNRNTNVHVNERLELRFLHAKSYDANISVARLTNHRQLGRAFTRRASVVPNDEKPDVIFATIPVVELAAAAAEYGEANGVPVVIDVRDLHPDIYLSLVPKFVHPVGRTALLQMYRDLRTSLGLATGIVAIAPSFLKWALRHAGRRQRQEDRVFPLAYPEIDADEEEIDTAATQLEALGVKRNRKILWYVGTFNRWIDIGVPIDAMRKLQHEGRTDFQLVISGSGDFENEWRERAGGLDNVVFTGWIGVPHILHMRSIAWAGVAPYRPGFLTVGNKLFEYMAGGLPVLLSIGGDARTTIESHDCGVGYDGTRVESFIDALSHLEQPGVHSRMSANALTAYRNHFSAEKVYGEMVKYIEHLGEGGAPLRAELLGRTNAAGPEITEAAGDPADELQLRRMITRYHWAASYCDGKDVLEVACGTGQGLGLIRSRAESVIACDLSAENLQIARFGNGPAQAMLRADAQLLPFADQSLDVVILLEALYFLPSGEKFVSEARRVLRKGGICLTSAVNKDCVGFNPRHSFYTDLYGARELSSLMKRHGFTTECFGITRIDEPSITSPVVSSLKKIAVTLDLIPESKKARIMLKRVLPGRLETMPYDISTVSLSPETPLPIACDSPDMVHQAVLCAARKM